MRKTLKPPLLGYYTMAGGGAAPVATPWYLAGDIDAADCVAAYLAKGAASYAASKANLTGNTDYDLTENDGAVTWDAVNGWKFVPGNSLLSTGYAPKSPVSFIVRCKLHDDPINEAAIPGQIYGDVLFGININEYGSVFLYGIYDLQAEIVRMDGVLALTPKGGYVDGALATDEFVPQDAFESAAALALGGGWSEDVYTCFDLIDIQAAAIYSKALSDAEVEALTTAMYAL